MIYSTAKDVVRERMTRHSSNSGSFTSFLDSEFDLAKQRLERGPVLPWFLEALQSITTTASVQTEALASGHIRGQEEAMWLVPTSGAAKPLVRLNYREALTDPRWSGLATGEPRAYSLFDETIYFWPIPSAVYTIKYLYYAEDAAFVDEEENNWLANFPDLLISEVGYIIAGRYLRNDPVAQAFAQDIAREATRMTRAVRAREMADNDYTPED